MKKTLFGLAALFLSSCGDTYNATYNYFYERDGGSVSAEEPDQGTSFDAGLETPDAALSREDAAVTEPCVNIEWFLDYQSPFDRRYFVETHPEIVENYGTLVHFRYKHFPLSFHMNARPAAEAAECARLQGSFLPYHNRLFEDQFRWAEAKDALDIFRGYATEFDLDLDAFDACRFGGMKIGLVIDADIEEGMMRGVKGVPTFYINGTTEIVGAQPYETFAGVIDAELSRCADGM